VTGAVGTDAEDGVLWLPERIQQAGLPPDEVARLRYVVVEELVDGVASLLAWSWPHVDGRGRLFWRPSEQDQPVEISAPLRHLAWQVYDAAELERQPRCGDTFAARVVAPDQPFVEDLREVFPDGVYDLSPEAHQAAKLAYQGALADLRERPYEQDEPVLFDVQQIPLALIRLRPPVPRQEER
jgi:hypothetical protein